MKRIGMMVATVGAWVLMVVSAGCSKDGGMLDATPGDKTEVFFTAGSDLLTTRADVRSALLLGETFRVLVYEQGADPVTAVPLAVGSYRIVDAQGAAVPAMASDRIFLQQGTYDFCFIIPDTDVESGKVNAANGTSVLMSDRQRVEIQPDTNGRCGIEVSFTRRTAMLDVEIWYETGRAITSLSVFPQDQLVLSGLPSGAAFPIDGGAAEVSTDLGSITIRPDLFQPVTEPAGAGTAGISTFVSGVHQGADVIPADNVTLEVSVVLAVNGSAQPYYFKTTVAGAKLEAGKYYTLKLKVTATEFTRNQNSQCYRIKAAIEKR